MVVSLVSMEEKEIKKNLSEETLGLGNVGVPSSFVASQWLEEKAGW